MSAAHSVGPAPITTHLPLVTPAQSLPGGDGNFVGRIKEQRDGSACLQPAIMVRAALEYRLPASKAAPRCALEPPYGVACGNNRRHI